jgi:two-component system sensor histidine kinase DesK
MHKPGRPAQAWDRSPTLPWLAFVVWLAFLVPPVSDLVRRHPPLLHLGLTLLGVALFAGVYTWATGRNARSLVDAEPVAKGRPWDPWLLLAVLSALGVTVVLYDHATNWLELFIFTAAYAAGRLLAVRAALAVIALALLTLVTGLLAGSQLDDIGSAAVFVLVTGIVTFGMVQSIRNGRELRAARQEIARLAVLAERERIARDLHDLLGHNLSLIALKSELARRLMSVAPERAASEIGDVEQVARSTLQEVREAVADYRRLTLADEVRGAQEILAAAGIAYQVEGEENAFALPGPQETVLAATVREGVTNVIRHSHARHCIIRLSRDALTAGVEVADNGTGASSAGMDRVPDAAQPSAPETGAATARRAPGMSQRGSGLDGLAERVAALGGRFEAGPRTEGGFRLAVCLPLMGSPVVD